MEQRALARAGIVEAGQSIPAVTLSTYRAGDHSVWAAADTAHRSMSKGASTSTSSLTVNQRGQPRAPSGPPPLQRPRPRPADQRACQLSPSQPRQDATPLGTRFRQQASPADDWSPVAADAAAPSASSSLRRIAVPSVAAPTVLRAEPVVGIRPFMPTRAPEASEGEMRTAADMDALHLASELASFRLPEASMVSEASNSQWEITCSSRLAEVSRDRIALQSQLSKAKLKLASNNSAKDKQLTKVISERDDLLKRLRASQKYMDIAAKENKQLHGRLAEAIAWSKPSCFMECAPRGDISGTAPSATIYSCMAVAVQPSDVAVGIESSGAIDRRPSLDKQVVFECGSLAFGHERTSLPASMAVSGEGSNSGEAHIVTCAATRMLVLTPVPPEPLRDVQGEVAPSRIRCRGRVGALGVRHRPEPSRVDGGVGA